VVQLNTGEQMVAKGKESAQQIDERKTLRASVTFPRELYATVERIAKEKKVSVAWIVREAAEMYVAGQLTVRGRQSGRGKT
jgi:metal-responsive CopG/Arc/MetJ family transcriptional regulator